MLSIGESLPSYGSDSSLTASAISARRSAATLAAVSTATSVATAVGAGVDQLVPAEKGTGDAGVKAYRQAAQQLAANSAGAADTQTTLEINRLKAADAAVRAHEAAHMAAGGSLVHGGASFTYQQGPDGKQYAIGGEVSIDVSPVPGNPQATIQKMETVRAAALAPADPSAQDRAVAAAASQAAAAARAELSRGKTKEAGASTETSGQPTQPDFGQVAAQISAAQAQQVQATYGAFGVQTAVAEPTFQAAA